MMHKIQVGPSFMEIRKSQDQATQAERRTFSLIRDASVAGSKGREDCLLMSLHLRASKATVQPKICSGIAVPFDVPFAVPLCGLPLRVPILNLEEDHCKAREGLEPSTDANWAG